MTPGGTNRGAVHLLYLNSDGTVQETQETVEINDNTTNGPVLSDSDVFGWSVASLGNLDGTGGAATVLAVGAINDDAGGTNHGAVHLLYLNSNGTVRKTVEINDLTTNGPVLSNNDQFGHSVTSLGDLDGAGVGAAAVLAVGAANDDAGEGTATGGSDRGAVHLLYLNSNGTVQKTVEINDLTANGPALSNDDEFGESVASLGDLDGPGGAATVLAVGAITDDAGGSNRGAVHLLYLESDGDVQKTVEINDLTANGHALSNEDLFGLSVANLGDLDGDGVSAAAVLAVGASGDDTGGANRGAVHLLYLNSDGTVQKTMEINDTTAGGPVLSNNDEFGFSVANLGDLDGTGGPLRALLAVGTPFDDAGGANRGAVHLLFIE